MNSNSFIIIPFIFVRREHEIHFISLAKLDFAEEKTHSFILLIEVYSVVNKSGIGVKKNYPQNFLQFFRRILSPIKSYVTKKNHSANFDFDSDKRSKY